MNRTRLFMSDVFGLSLPDCQYFVFKRVLAARYEALAQEIFRSLLEFRSLHIDETSVNLKGRTGYVWVLAGVDRAFYFYRPTREVTFLSEMLASFNGVLISDFYSGYDALKCNQQKCLIHFMRDINEDMLKNPFDSELKFIAECFATLLRAIVESIDKYGLKHRHLAKHRKEAAGFLGWLQSREFTSDTANSYKKRLAKSGQRMFTFLEHDGVPWNNNNAEHAIKRFAKYRRETGGRFTEPSLKEYLILATVFETCEFNNVSALRFLLSGETTLAGLLKLAERRTCSLGVDRDRRRTSVCVLAGVKLTDGPCLPKQGAEIQTESGVANINQGLVCLESSPSLSKFARKWRFEVVEQKTASCLGGLVAVEGLIQQFGLWKLLEFDRESERRFLALTGISEKAMITQLLYSSCAGGANLADAEVLGSDALARQLAGCRKFACRSILQQWLSNQTDARIASLHRLNVSLVSGIAELTDVSRRIELEGSLWCRSRSCTDKGNPNDPLHKANLGEPDSLDLTGNPLFCAIAGIAQNLLAALKLIYLPDDCLALNPQSLQRRVIFLPAEVLRHSRRTCVRIHVPAAWQTWWQRLAKPLKLPVVST